MSAPIDFTWKIDYDRSGRNDAADATRVTAARARIAASVVPANQGDAQPGQIQTQITTSDVDTILPATPHSETRPVVHGGAAAPDPVEEDPILVRINWRLKLKERLWPRSFRKRLAKEAGLAHAIPEHTNEPVEEFMERPSLPGAGLQKLKDQDGKPQPPSPVDETDLDTTRGDYDDQISALPPMPGHQRQASAVPSEDFGLPIREHQNEEPSLEDLMDVALNAADTPGNRCSVRSPLPPEWRAAE
ncbi:hypothetical protein E8E12_009352 [Didymella heteroderae]|uniref:Uncharacterized protein n=1 Tax=Didymella heteroderae TaxID=1769908 RepID=A0A9P4WRZ7_9PLEO|nr:hypothetical protein E8E12_009352 [Didymella heteroderae]